VFRRRTHGARKRCREAALSKRVIAGGLGLALIAGAAVAGPYEDGAAALARGDAAAAFQAWLPLAQSGDARAENDLGNLYVTGNGVKPDLGEAVRWFRAAAEQGLPAGEGNLGFMYDHGLGVAQDFGEAVKWYDIAIAGGDADAASNRRFLSKRAELYSQHFDTARQIGVLAALANDGDVTAMVLLGGIYSRADAGRDEAQALKWYRMAAQRGDRGAEHALGSLLESGASKDYAEAMRWFRAAAEQGDGASMDAIGRMYEAGWGVARDPAAAFQWYRTAYDSGWHGSAYDLSRLYEKGDGVTQDLVQALAWRMVGGPIAVDCATCAIEGLQRLARRMSQAEIDAAEQLAASRSKSYTRLP
jgi:TPR repeat protein